MESFHQVSSPISYKINNRHNPLTMILLISYKRTWQNPPTEKPLLSFFGAYFKVFTKKMLIRSFLTIPHENYSVESLCGDFPNIQYSDYHCGKSSIPTTSQVSSTMKSNLLRFLPQGMIFRV